LICYHNNISTDILIWSYCTRYGSSTYVPYFLVQREELKKLDGRVAAGDAIELEKEGGHVSCLAERTTFTRKKSVTDGEM